MKRKKKGFGHYVQDLRSGAGWSLRELSAASGIPITRLWSIERGRHSPKLETLAAISGTFRQPLHRFLLPLG